MVVVSCTIVCDEVAPRVRDFAVEQHLALSSEGEEMMTETIRRHTFSPQTGQMPELSLT